MASYQLPDGRTVSDSMPFVLNTIQYPSNWLLLSTAEDRSRLGITLVPDPPTYDQRYYWAAGQPKDLDTLKSIAKFQQKQYAAAALAPTDWMIIRGAENPGKPASLEVKTYRAAVRDTSSAREAEIEAATTVDELVGILNTLTEWPDVLPN